MAKTKRKNKGGRPRSTLPKDLIEKLGPPPTGNPFGLAKWYGDMIAELTWRIGLGEPLKDYLETIRASAGAAGRVLPHDIIGQAAAILREDADLLKNTGSGPLPTRREGVRGHSKASRRET